MRQADIDLIDRLLDIAELDDIDHNICDDARAAAIRIRQLAHDLERCQNELAFANPFQV
jgi:hypothetical protein